jgi:two-component system LytT family sensor kinase
MFRLDKVYEGWSFERLSRHFIYWGFWTLLWPTINMAKQDGSFSQFLLFELTVLPVKLIYSYLVLYLLIPRFLNKKKYLPFIGWFAALGLLAGIAVGFLDVHIISPIIFGKDSYPVGLDVKVIYKMIDQMQTVAFVIVIKVVQRQMLEERSSQILARQKLDAELKLLKNQLQPHFLFNTLNNLYGMVLTKDEKAPDLLLKLSDVLSYMLYECNDQFVLLEKEVKILKDYMKLEKIRYGKKLNLTFSTDGDFSNKKVAPLLYFPLIENAFKHGPAKLDRESGVIIHLSMQKEELHFMVRNERIEIGEQTQQNIAGGVGLENVKARLSLLYPDRHELNIKKTEQHFEVNLTLHLQ